ncbi:rRNA accumulation- protein [Coemansia sp. RSA 1290]|nr:rRNA accumulation- protein [Coemansia sp. RSA 1290]
MSQIHPNKAAFIEGVDHVLKKWTALELAVQHEWGGRDSQEKRDDMVEEITGHFDNLVSKRQAPEETDLQELLLDIMDEDFSVTLEDGSEKEVARIICTIFQECKQGNFATVDKLAEERDARERQQSTGRTAVTQSQASGQHAESDSEDDGSNSDVSMNE